MTTPRIEEIEEKLPKSRVWLLPNEDMTDEWYIKKSDVEKALTQAHQAGYADGYKQGKFDAEVTAEYGEPQALQDNK